MNEFKKVELKADVPRKQRAPGLSIAQLNHGLLGKYLDPYLMFDHFEMAEPFFAPHPHAGFSAVTYMFPESQNGFQNRDSRGDRHKIPPGAIHWTAAGRGIVHEEVPIVRGVVCEGLQIFVNLPSHKKMMDPQVFHLDRHEIAVVKDNLSEVRVVVGEHQGITSSLKPPTEVSLFDIWLKPGAIFRHEFKVGETGFVYTLKGSVHIGEEDSCVELHSGQAAGISESGSTLQIVSQDVSSHLVVGFGKPLREPVVIYGPFVMNTKEQIQEAVLNYQSGKMGTLEASF